MKKIVICSFGLIGNAENIRKVMYGRLDELFSTDDDFDIFMYEYITKVNELFMSVIYELMAKKYINKKIRIFEQVLRGGQVNFEKTFPNNGIVEIIRIAADYILYNADYIVSNLYRELYDQKSYINIRRAEKKKVKIIYITETETETRILNLINDTLTEQQKFIITKRREGITYKKISEMLKLSDSRIRYKEHVGRRKVRALLFEELNNTEK